MNSDTALADIMTMLNVTTPDAAVDQVRHILERAPVLGVDDKGRLSIAPGVTVGIALQLLDAARATILSTKLTA